MQSEKTKWIAVDWGTSSLRVWIFGDDPEPIATLQSKAGMGTLAKGEFEPALMKLIDTYLPSGKSTPIVCCGMVGARQGWQEAPYQTVPCSPPDASTAIQVNTDDPRLNLRILSGVKQSEPADVMRGEETQIAGFLSQNDNFDGVICLPGTHTKWVQISAGEIVSFKSFMSGEIFALLSGQSVLRHGIAEKGWDDQAFAEAINDAISDPQKIAGRLFQLRAEGLLNDLDPIVARSRLSGYLIGTEFAAARPFWLGSRVALLGSEHISAPYFKALEHLGLPTERLDAEHLTLTGLASAYKALKGK